MLECDPRMCLRSFCVANPNAVCRINPCGDKCAIEFYDENNNVVDCTRGASQCHMERHRVMLMRNELELMVVEKNHTMLVAEIMHSYMLELAPGLLPPHSPPPLCHEHHPPPPGDNIPGEREKMGSPPKDNQGPPPPGGERPPPPPPGGERPPPTHFRPPPPMCIDRKVCAEPKKSGPCKAAVPRWYFNSETGMCEQFTWGGCQPNKNNFKEEIECKKACSDIHDMAGIYEPHCHREHDDKRHGGYQYKQCHDNLCWCVSSDGKPVQGTLTKGKLECDENGRIASESDKVAVCADKSVPAICARSCHEAKCEAAGFKICVADPCNNCKVTFYTMNHKEVQCKTEGIDQPKPVDVCEQPMLVGRCRARIPKWAFNSKSGKCEQFFYGGCQGNDNRFDTKAECVTKCPESSCPSDSEPALQDVEDCADKKCFAYPEAQCAIDPCTGKHKFIDLITGQDVDSCEKVTGLCQRENAKRKLTFVQSSLTKEALGDEINNQIAPPSMVQCDSTGKYEPKQCLGDECRCVDEFGVTYGGQGGKGLICEKQQVTKIRGEIKLNADFNKIVNNMDTFTKTARKTISEKLKIMEEMVIIKSIMPGSILIVFEVENTDHKADLPARVSRLEEEVDDREFAIEFEGEVMRGEEMNIEYDALHHKKRIIPDETKEEEMDPTSQMVFIVAIACVSAFVVILTLVCVVSCCRKNTKGSRSNDSENGSEKNLAFSNPDYAAPEELKVRL